MTALVRMHENRGTFGHLNNCLTSKEYRVLYSRKRWTVAATDLPYIKYFLHECVFDHFLKLQVVKRKEQEFAIKIGDICRGRWERDVIESCVFSATTKWNNSYKILIIPAPRHSLNCALCECECEWECVCGQLSVAMKDYECLFFELQFPCVEPENTEVLVSVSISKTRGRKSKLSIIFIEMLELHIHRQRCLVAEQNGSHSISDYASRLSCGKI